MIHEVLADLQDSLDALQHVLIPDWLDQLDHCDWETLDQLQNLSKTIHTIVMAVCDEYRIIAHESRNAARKAWSGNGAPSGPVAPTGPGG